MELPLNLEFVIHRITNIEKIDTSIYTNNSPRKTSMANQFCSYLQFSTLRQTQRASLMLFDAFLYTL